MMAVETGGIALVLGFLLGLKHATDADHVVAVATIVSEYRNPWRGIWVGASWGLGHSTPLLLVGLVILLLKETVLDQYESVAPALEFGVGIMLVLLGLQVIWRVWRGTLHVHRHEHADGEAHFHVHVDTPSDPPEPAHRPHHWLWPGRPFFRLKSYLVGCVHGLAGSAAVMLVLLPSIEGPLLGVGYLVLFGVGTMLSMAAITLLLGVPFALSARFDALNRGVAAVAGVLSMAVGASIMAEITTGTALLPF